MIAFTACALFSLAAPAATVLVLAQEEAPELDVDAKLARLDGVLAEDLWAYAGWCTERKLFAERLRVLEQLVALQPEHAEAREMLGHKKQKDGTWKAPERKRALEDSAVDEAELTERRNALVRDWRDQVLALVDRGGWDRAEREQLLRAILALAPDDPEAHQRLGEVRYGRAWLCAESGRAYDRRPEIRALVAEALSAAARPESLLVEEPAERFGFSFPVAVKTPSLRVLSTGSLEEALTVAQACEATGSIFRRVFACRTPFPVELTLYLLENPDDRPALLAALPDLTDEERLFLAQLEVAGIPRTADAILWASAPDHRLDGAVRHVLAGFLRDEFQLWTDDAWCWEGIGLYLTREIVGTRLTWYVDPVHEEPQRRSGPFDRRRKRALPGAKEVKVPDRAELLAAHASWIDPAWRLLKKDAPPSLAKVMTSASNALDLEGLLSSYALSVYLLEGRPDALPEVLARVGRDQPPEEVVREALGMTMDELLARIVRFLSERRAPSYWDA